MSTNKPTLSTRLLRLAGSLIVAALIIAAGTIGAITLLEHGDNHQQPVQLHPLPVQTLTAHAVPGYMLQRNYSGRITVRRNSALGFERAGLLIKLSVDDGEHIRTGQSLAELDTEILRIEYQRLLAKKKEAQARLELAKATTARLQKLKKTRNASAQSLDEANFEQKAVAAQLQEIRTAIQAVDINLQKSVLKAPFDGTVSLRLADEGTVIASGQPVLQLLETSRLEARIGVPVAQLDALGIGTEHTLLIHGKTVKGKVTALLPQLDTHTRTVTVIFSVPADTHATDHELAHLQLAEFVATRGFWLPISALNEGERGLWSVYTLQPDAKGDGSGTVDRHSVEVLHTTSDSVYVRGTLRDGLDIIDGGTHRLVPGQHVKSLTAAPA